MNTQQLFKRSVQLAPLSREHKDGMEFVDRLRYGICHTSLDRLRCYAGWYWKNHIRPHFFQEEKILLPYLPVDHPLAKKLKEDHEQIRDLIITLDQESNAEYIAALADVIVTHIKFEEAEVFTYLEQTLSKDKLDNIYLQLENHPVSGEDWADKFWT